MSDRQSELGGAYHAARPRLVRVAYAVLGGRAEAEDVVSDCIDAIRAPLKLL